MTKQLEIGILLIFCSALGLFINSLNMYMNEKMLLYFFLFVFLALFLIKIVQS